MENFVYHNSTKIIFGKSAEFQVGKEIKKYTNKILLHYGEEYLKKVGAKLYDNIIKSLRENEIEIIELSGVKPNPRLSLVREGIKICKENKINFILAVGGGSVIDSAKAIAVGIYYNGDVWDLFQSVNEIKESLHIGAILTTAATGSESSKNAVITNEDGWYKKALANELIRPKFAILNPELTFTLSTYQTICGAVDIMTHVMERYFTQIDHIDFTDRLCEATLKTIIKNITKVLDKPDNYDARAEILWASTIAHNDLLGTGRIEDWASHKIDNEIGAIYDIAHGAGLAVIYPNWMKYVSKSNVKKFTQFAIRVFDVDPFFETPEEIALEGIRKLQNFFKEIGMATTFHELNIGDDRFDEMATKCTKSGPVGNFMKLYKDDVLNILRLSK